MRNRTLNPEHPSTEAVLANHDVRISVLEKKIDTLIKLGVSCLVAALSAAVSAGAHILMHAKGL